jgi:hypothetical protein
MTDAEREQILEAKAFYLAAPALLPLVEKMERNALGTLLMEFRAGKTELLPYVAALNSYVTMRETIKRKEQEFNSLQGSTNGTADRK